MAIAKRAEKKLSIQEVDMVLERLNREEVSDAELCSIAVRANPISAAMLFGFVAGRQCGRASQGAN